MTTSNFCKEWNKYTVARNHEWKKRLERSRISVSEVTFVCDYALKE